MPVRTIEGAQYELVRAQRSGVCVYRGKDSYLRIGPKELIAKQLETHRHMESSGFPVAKLLSEGSDEDDAYFRESSLGDKRFLELFEDDIASSGNISGDRFAQYLVLIEKYLVAQLASGERSRNVDSFRHAVHIDTLIKEMPHYRDAIENRFQNHMRAIQAFPFRLMHGDLGPANIYPLGVIDFEDTASGPVGFDAASAIMTTEWFPQSHDYEFFERARFSEEQFKEYLAHCDRILSRAGLPKLSDSFDCFAFFRAAWLTANMHDWPKLQKYRYDLFIEKYLT